MTTGTTPKPRVIRFETEWKGEYVPVGCEALNVRLEEIREDRLRAIVAIPRKCRVCRDGTWTVERGEAVTRMACPRCGGTMYERCKRCVGTDGSRRVEVVKAVADVLRENADVPVHEGWPCPDCIDGVLHDEHEVAVREAIEKGIAGLVVASGIKGSVHAAAVLSALIGEGSETP